MASEYISMRNLKFLVHEVFDVASLSKYELHSDYNPEMFDMILDTAKDLADAELFPYYMEMDKLDPKVENGSITVHPQVGKVIKRLGEDGWISARKSYELGGQQMPYSVLNNALCIFYAANFAAVSYTGLTAGSANLIDSFGSEKLKELYLGKMYSGEWQGTMALTEPQAGSSLTDIVTSAELTDEGYYKIKGQKIFISGGDHTGVPNIVHLTLAKIEGGPAGAKGISLFVVPKHRYTESGDLEYNDVLTAGKFDKMGSHAYVTTHLSFGENEDCRGYLVGEPHYGLKYMFQMMNEARIAVGMTANAIATAAYYASLQYAIERPQGRHISKKDVSFPQVPIIEHADVRRMLLFQKAITEGSQSLVTQTSFYADMEHVTEGEEQEEYRLLLEFLTPIVKTFPSDMGNLSVSTGLQCLGGYGYCKDFPLEQYYRDIRINSIYEGTSGIQGMDLLGRKVLMKNGKATALFFREVGKAIQEGSTVKGLEKYASDLQEAMQLLQKTTGYLIDLAQKDRPEVFLADATLYLEMTGNITIAWQWLLQGIVAAKVLEKGELSEDELNFYNGKIHTLKYYFLYELPKIQGLNHTLLNSGQATLHTPISVLV
ncbi:MAG: butyryl-CoA dehydrogenase [Saprospiraceae bacterium]|jgi:alkylation response protein AidB-like acyl-CoA dehydrogenase|tara:strand:- start:45 stop:1850 length:1806 start_codon:yes stop_codon:yes gene_type:complete